jgi:pyruvate/2-oxoglutarate dehydrogenase complex dihydrolipoamide dehydrogenase (E3) component
MSYQYQVIVIGSGSAGKDAALQAAREGLRTLLIEAGRIGGTGIHRGCHAVRTLRACATHYERVKESHHLGVYPDLVTTNWSSWLEVQSRVTNRLATELSCALERAAVDVKFGRAALFDPQTVVITDDIGKKETVTGDSIILASILYEKAIRFDHKTSNSASGALVAYSGSLFIWTSRTALRGILGGLGSDALPEFGL